jgi:DNA processing protein
MNEKITDDERIARAELTWLAEPGDTLLGALVSAAGPVEAMALIRSGQLPADATRAPAWGAREAMSLWHASAGKVPGRGEVARSIRGRVRLVCPGDAEWPAMLDELGDARPHALWATGTADIAWSCRQSVAVTGTRPGTSYGTYLAAELAASLSAQGRAIVSGGTSSIDVSAHRGALAADGVAVAVLAGGVDIPYLAAHADLLSAVAAQGVLVSEWPPGAHPSRLRSIACGRIVAALATGTVVVEADTSSEALGVARHALALGRPVMAVPGPVTSGESAGCNDLIRQGQAVLVTSAADVISTLSTAALPAQPA